MEADANKESQWPEFKICFVKLLIIYTMGSTWNRVYRAISLSSRVKYTFLPNPHCSMNAYFEMDTSVGAAKVVPLLLPVYLLIQCDTWISYDNHVCLFSESKKIRKEIDSTTSILQMVSFYLLIYTIVSSSCVDASRVAYSLCIHVSSSRLHACEMDTSVKGEAKVEYLAVTLRRYSAI